MGFFATASSAMGEVPSRAARNVAVLVGLIVSLASAQAAPGADRLRSELRASAAESEITAPMAVGAKLERSGNVTRLSFDTSTQLTPNVYLLEAPDRVIVDLPQVDFQIDPTVGHPRPEPGALVRSFRFGLLSPGRSRIVIDLAGPAALRVATAPIAGGDPSRLTIELTKSDRSTFHKAALDAPIPAPDPPAETASVPMDQPRPGSLPVVVIDPGHGGIDPGASGNGVVEKAVVFDFASALATKLSATGRYTVIMTRKDDTFVSLRDRVRIARDAGAAVCVSIHADALATTASVTGATVYTASDRASDAEAARVADSENQADAAAGLDSTPVSAGVDDILFDLTRRETRTYAHLFQRTLVGYWEKIARLNKNPERAAGFVVLQAPDVPSVLLELGYLSSDRDVKNLSSPEWRESASNSIVTAIDSFFAPRQPKDQGSTAGAASAPSGKNPFGTLVRASSN